MKVDLHEGELQAETKHLLEGKQGAVMFQNRPFAKEVYDYAKEQDVNINIIQINIIIFIKNTIIKIF